MLLVSSGHFRTLLVDATEGDSMVSRINTVKRSPREAVASFVKVAEGSAIHNVRTSIAVVAVDTAMYTTRRLEGRGLLKCSRCDRTQTTADAATFVAAAQIEYHELSDVMPHHTHRRAICVTHRDVANTCNKNQRE
jgi:hypothetical protein